MVAEDIVGQCVFVRLCVVGFVCVKCSERRRRGDRFWAWCLAGSGGAARRAQAEQHFVSTRSARDIFMLFVDQEFLRN